MFNWPLTAKGNVQLLLVTYKRLRPCSADLECVQFVSLECKAFGAAYRRLAYAMFYDVGNEVTLLSLLMMFVVCYYGITDTAHVEGMLPMPCMSSIPYSHYISSVFIYDRDMP